MKAERAQEQQVHDPRALDGARAAAPVRSGPPTGRAGMVWLQRAAGNRAVCSVQRHGENEEGEPELIRQLEAEIAAAMTGMDQDRDKYLRASSTRLHLLLTTRAHPRFATQAQLDAFIDSAHRLSATELDTLGALGPAAAEIALQGRVKGFPLTWSGRVHAALTLGVDPAALLGDAAQRLTAITADAAGLPPRLVDKGLPVPFADVARLTEFVLRIAHTALPQGNAVGDFARSTARYAQFRFYAHFAFTWEMIANQVAGAVADGSYVPRSADYENFVQNRQRILRELPARARDRMAMTDEELQAIQRDSVGLSDAALVAGMAGALAAIGGIFTGWQEGERLFATNLQAADGLVAGAGDGERVLMALRWLWDAGYVSGAAIAQVTALIEQGPEMLKSLAVIVVLQMIPFVNLGVDIYLAFQLGADILAQLTELGLSLSEVTGARTVVAMQRAAARLARVLTAGGGQILTTLVTMGVVRGVSALRARTARIRAANPALTEEQAMRQAMREAPAAERAPLEAARGLDTWERGLSRETRPILDTPGVRARLAGLSDRTRRILTECRSPCLPPAHQLLDADLARLDRTLDRLGVSGTHTELREYFYRRRDSLAQAIDDLDRGVPDATGLNSFLDRAVVSASRLPPGVTVSRGAGGRWTYRRPDGSQVLEYDIRAYGTHGTSTYGTNSFFQSHHGIQGHWARTRGVPGYDYHQAPGILLRDSRRGSPHNIVNGRQTARRADIGTRTYPDELAEMRRDLADVGVPESVIQAVEAENNRYFGALYRAAQRTATPAQLRAWFGTWVP